MNRLSCFIAEKIPSLIYFNEVSLEQAPFWENCLTHLTMAKQPTLNCIERTFHFLCGNVQRLPVIGQVSAFFEDYMRELILTHVPDEKKKALLCALLLEAVECNDVSAVKNILKSPFVDVNFPNVADGRIALFTAVYSEREEIVQLLVDAGADLNAKHKNGMGLMGPLKCAKLLKNKNIIAILERPGREVLKTVKKAIDKNDVGELKRLIEKGFDFKVRDSKGDTALFRAIRKGDEEIVLLLLEGGADPNYKNSRGRSPIHPAAYINNKKILKLLIIAGARPESEVCKEDSYESIFTCFKKNRPKDYKKRIKEFAPQHPQLFKKSKEYLHIKAISHTIGLGGEVTLLPYSRRESSFSFSIEGMKSPFWLNQMAKASRLMGEKYPEILPCFSALCESLESASNLNQKSVMSRIVFVLEQIREKQIVCLITGYTEEDSGHTIALLISKKWVVFCNRGALSRSSVEFFRYNRKKLDQTVIKLIWSKKNEGREEVSEFLFTTLVNQLELRKGDLEYAIEKACPLPPQEHGICSWTSPETFVWAFLVIQKIREQRFLQDELLSVVEGICEQETKRFYSWLVFNQLYHLERYMNVYQLRKQPEKEKKLNKQRDLYKINLNFLDRAFKESLLIEHESIDPSIDKERNELFKKFARMCCQSF